MIGERLRELRKDKYMTQDELASILNVDKTLISSYETNKSEPTDAIKLQLAKLFNVSIDYLIGLTSIPNVFQKETNFFRTSAELPFLARPHLLDYSEFLIQKYKK